MNYLHKNYRRAFNLTLVVFSINTIAAIVVETGTSDTNLTSIEILDLIIRIVIIYLGLAYLIRRGYNWVKYLFIILFIGGLLFGDLPSFENVYLGVSGLISMMLQLWIIILLFNAK